MSETAQEHPVATPWGERLTIDSVLHWLMPALVASWAGYFLFTGMPQLTLEVFPRTVVLHAMVGGMAAVYAGYLAFARRLPGGTPLDLPLLGLLAAYALATVTSESWRVSLDATLLLGAGVIAFYALSGLPYVTATQLRRAFQLTGAALAVYALWVVGNDYADYLRFTRAVEGLDRGNIFPPTVPRVHDVSDHPNVLAMLLTLVLPFFALSAYSSPSRWERIAGGAALLAGALAIFLTLSRGGWIGAGTGIALTLGGAWVTTRSFERERQGFAFSWENVVPRELSPTALAALGGALLLAGGGALAFLARSSTRPGWLFRSSLSPRRDAWEAGLDIFRDNPLTGAGPNTFGLLYAQYSGKFAVHTQHAHNGFLQVADDAGLVGLLALAALGVAVGWMLWRTWRRGTLEQRLLAVTCGAALIGFSLHNQLDAGNIWKAPLIALAFVGAIVARNYGELPTQAGAAPDALPWRRPLMLALRGGLLALAVLPFAAWYRIDRAHEDYWRGMRDIADGATYEEGLAEALPQLQDAVDQDSSMMAYRLQLGQAEAWLFEFRGRRELSLIGGAIGNLRQAVKLDERSAIAHANLARAYEMAGREEEAALEAAKTRVTARTHVTPVLVAGEVYERLGRDEDAVATYGQVLSMDAGIADSAFWHGSAFRREHFDEILERSAIGVNACTYGAYLVQAQRSDPRAALDALDEASRGCQLLVFSLPQDLVLRVAFAKILMAQGDADTAFEHLDYAASRQPDFGPARTELGRWYEAQGDVEAARREWRIGGELDEAESLLLVGRTYPADEVPQEIVERLREQLAVSGSNVRYDLISILHYRMRYGRASPHIAFIPGDWLTAVPRLYVEMEEAVASWERG